MSRALALMNRTTGLEQLLRVIFGMFYFVQTQRVEALKQEVDQTVRMAELIEYNLEDVDNAILAVRSILASGMDWKDLTRMIKEEKKAGNPVAGLIHSLQLDKNQITLLLSNNLDDMDDDEKTQPVNKVSMTLSFHPIDFVPQGKVY